MANQDQIDPRGLWDRLFGRQAREFFILDVRNEDEARRWKVEGPLPVPTVNIPYFDFLEDEEGELARVPADLGEAVVICAKGGSSDYVAGLLRQAGRPAVNLDGGMAAWGDLHVPLRIPTGPGDGAFELWQINRYGKGCLSYLIVAGDEAAVVDPSRFTDVYMRLAAERGARIVEVLETHVHADHLSGGALLARQTGARLRVLAGHGAEPRLEVPITPFDADQTEIRLGSGPGVAIQALAIRTPGHTPGSVSYLVADRYLLSGDTLFVQGVGRPDLGGHVEEWGRALFKTLNDVVARLPDDLVVLPAHFSSRSEVGADGIVQGRLGDLREQAPEFAIADPDEFVAAMRAGVQEPPAIYAEIVRANLGLVEPGERASEWELGRNECAASAHLQATAGPGGAGKAA